MRQRRPIAETLLGLVVGLCLGLLAARVWPVEYDSVTPELLTLEHQIDYANMIAVIYDRDDDLHQALARLARLGPAARTALDALAPTHPAAARLLADLSATPTRAPAD